MGTVLKVESGFGQLTPGTDPATIEPILSRRHAPNGHLPPAGAECYASLVGSGTTTMMAPARG